MTNIIQAMAKRALPAKLIKGSIVTTVGKQAILGYAKDLVAMVEREGFDVTNLTAYAARQKEFWAEVVASGKTAIYEEVARYGKEGLMRVGVKLETTTTGVTKDYSLDPVWSELNEQCEALTDKMTRWENKLDKLPYEGEVIINPSTGEMYLAHPPAKKGTSTVKCTIIDPNK